MLRTYLALVLMSGLLILHSQPSLGDSICDEQTIDKLLKSGTPAFGDNEFTRLMSGSHLTIVGEIHFYTDLQSRLTLIREFNNLHPRNSCVAFELPLRDIGTDVSLANFHDAIERLKLSPEFQKTPNGGKLIAAYQQLYAYYSPMANLAVELGMKARSVDHKDHFDSSKGLDDRNHAMADNLKSLVSRGECDSMLMFVGKAHVAMQDDASTTLQTLSRRNGLSVTTINLQMTRENLPLTVRSWAICPSQKKVLQDYAVIRNSELETNPPLFPFLVNDRTKWKDFDFTILVP